MKFLQKYILYLLVIFGIIGSVIPPVSAQLPPNNEFNPDRKQKLIENFIKFAQLEQQQNQLNKSCQKGNLVACTEVKKIELQIKQLNER